MNLGENIHNAFEVVYKTFQSIEKLMLKCKSELDEDRYYMPVEKFLRYSSDQSWQGWTSARQTPPIPMQTIATSLHQRPLKPRARMLPPQDSGR